MNRNIAGNGKINQDLTFAKKGRTYGFSQNEERRKKKNENVLSYRLAGCILYDQIKYH